MTLRFCLAMTFLVFASVFSVEAAPSKLECTMSLAHAFRYAGCRSIIMTLWPAEDEGTAALMEHFYQHLAAGLAKDEALRRARLDYLETADPRRSHPYYWTHLVAVGDMKPLNRPFRSLPLLIGLAGIVAFTGLLFWRRQGKGGLK